MKTFVFITGASSGIGEAAAKRLAKEGKNLLLTARRKERLEKLEKQLKRAHGIEVIVRACDLTDRAAVEKLFDAWGKYSVEAVINNAGKALGREPIELANFDDLQQTMDLNISAFLHVLKLSIPLLKKSQGHLVNIGSIAGVEMYENGVTYCGTKHFVHEVTRGIRLELSGSGVRVTEIAPGNVDTEFSRVRYKGDMERVRKVYEGFEPLHAPDIADAIWYALSRPRHVNIQHLLIMPTAQAGSGKIARKG